jgi:lysylphosphatidylglycerol synthetase-like protein (DUF2156 family)
MAGRYPGGSITLWISGLLMFGNAATMLLSVLGLGTRRRLFYFFSLAVLAVNLVLTFTDQVGFLDWITFAIDLVLIALLVATRKLYP